MSSPKENFWIGAKGGLLDRKHLDAMGDAVWLFLYFLLRQTQINGTGEGVVLRGKPLSRKAISKDAGGWPEWKIKVWTARLIGKDYIRAVRVGNEGMVFFIRKGKSKAKNPKPSTLYFPVQCKPGISPPTPQVGTDSHRLESQVGTVLSGSRNESTPTHAGNAHASQADASFPTSLTSKSLSNYNKDPLAKNARSDFFSLLGKELTKQKGMPRGKTQAELDERRRLLLRQSEEIQARYAKPVEVSA